MMTMLPATLLESKILADLSHEAKAAILRAAEVRKTSPKEFVIHAAGPATHLYLLASGRAKFYRLSHNGVELLLRWLVPGDAFGIASLLNQPLDYMGTAETVEDSEFYVWPHATLRGLLKEYPQLGDNSLRVALLYLAEFVRRHAGLLTKTAEQRLANTLLKLGDDAGNVHHGGVQVDITNEQLSGLADVSPFTASRLLSRWERLGAIEKKRGKVLIQAPEKLLAS